MCLPIRCLEMGLHVTIRGDVASLSPPRYEDRHVSRYSPVDLGKRYTILRCSGCLIWYCTPHGTRYFSMPKADRMVAKMENWRSGNGLMLFFIASGVCCGHFWPIVPVPDDRWGWLWSDWWNEDWQGKPKYSEKTCPSATLSITNPTWPDPGLNPGRHGGKPATNRLIYGADRHNA
jgi:hypothetical protein